MEIGLIGEGVDHLHDIARAANQEVKLQNVMLTSLEEKMEAVHDRVMNVNEKLKVTLDEVQSIAKKMPFTFLSLTIVLCDFVA